MQQFLNKNGATKCPGMFSPELVAHNLQKQRSWDSMTPEERYKAKLSAHRPKRGRNSHLTEAQRAEKKRQYSKDYYENKKREAQEV